MPTHLITQLSPIAAKLYLTLHLYPDPAAAPPIAQVSLQDLSAHTGMSERSCTSALRLLLDLKLITRLPKPLRQSSRYQIHPFPNPQPAAPLLPDTQPVATQPTPHSQPAATKRHPTSQPVATMQTTTPIPASKSPHSQPV